jgi:hypothetical protein
MIDRVSQGAGDYASDQKFYPSLKGKKLSLRY